MAGSTSRQPSAPVESVSSEGSEKEAPVETDPSQDRTPPVLELLRFEPADTNDGGEVTLFVQASDDLPGVGIVRGVVSNPGGSALLPFFAQPDGSTEGTFAARITIPAKAETGIWYVSSLVLVDRANNPFTGSFTSATAPPGGTLRVDSAQSDSTPPEVLGVVVERPTLGGGEKTMIQVEVQDDSSGVAEVVGAFRSPSKSAMVPFRCHAGDDPAFWAGEASLPADAECGRWTLQLVRATDHAGNNAFLSGDSPLIAQVGFVVAGGRCDLAGLSLQRLDLSPTSVSNESASEIVVSADLGSTTTAIAVSGWVNGPASTNGQAPTAFFSSRRSSADPAAPWTGTITVPRLAAKGTWRVAVVRLQDASGALREYASSDPVLVQAFFEVR